ncbi:D-alanyl-D-alanine carboxypeptidase family protein [Vibrio fortis]|uniref:D-alanyl-D-alanine carboxypeptidase family protein n=1 Tax=Vibrio fortis TaxID=212667 RepID=UPI0040682085
MNAISKLALGVTLGLSVGAKALEVPPPSVEAKSYVVFDTNTNQYIASDNENERVQIASLTKVMTAYVVLKEIQNGTLSKTDIVTVSKKAHKMKGSRMFLSIGEKITVEELLRGLMVVSGNDAAVSLAEHISGSEGRFAQLMNSYAAKIGMEDSHFKNASGLPLPRRKIKEQYSTASDLAILADHLIDEFPEMLEVYSTKKLSHNDIDQDNRNKLLSMDSNYEGLKTGWTENAGYCIITSYHKGDRRVVSVVLGSKTADKRVQAANVLTNYGSRRFMNITPVSQEDALTDMSVIYGTKAAVKVYPAKSYSLTVPRDEAEHEKIRLLVDIFPNSDGKEALIAPAISNLEVGEVKVEYDGEVLETIPLITKEQINESGFANKLVDWIKYKLI